MGTVAVTVITLGKGNGKPYPYLWVLWQLVAHWLLQTPNKGAVSHPAQMQASLRYS